MYIDYIARTIITNLMTPQSIKSSYGVHTNKHT